MLDAKVSESAHPKIKEMFVDGKPYAEDYAAFKCALAKYLEVRGATVKEYGIRLCCLNLGGVATDNFWATAAGDMPEPIVNTLKPDFIKALLPADVVATVRAIIKLPPNVAVKDALVVATAYQ